LRIEDRGWQFDLFSIFYLQSSFLKDENTGLVPGLVRRRDRDGELAIPFFDFALMLDDEQQVVAVGNVMVPDESARLALFHPNADGVEPVGHAHGALQDFAVCFRFCHDDLIVKIGFWRASVKFLLHY
jgi:hypothetical protein